MRHRWLLVPSALRCGLGARPKMALRCFLVALCASCGSSTNRHQCDTDADCVRIGSTYCDTNHGCVTLLQPRDLAISPMDAGDGG